MVRPRAQVNRFAASGGQLAPRVVGEVGVLATTATLTYLVNTYVMKDQEMKEMKQYTSHLASLLAGSIFYPFQVQPLK